MQLINVFLALIGAISGILGIFTFISAPSRTNAKGWSIFFIVIALVVVVSLILVNTGLGANNSSTNAANQPTAPIVLATPVGNISGTWMDSSVSPPEVLYINQSGSSLSGTGVYHHVFYSPSQTLSGTISGKTIMLKLRYTSEYDHYGGPGCNADYTLTLSTDQKTMSGSVIITGDSGGNESGTCGIEETPVPDNPDVQIATFTKQ